MKTRNGNRLLDIRGTIFVETPSAIFFSDDGEKIHAKWLPRSQIEIEAGEGGEATITLPEWLAIEKGLV